MAGGLAGLQVEGSEVADDRCEALGALPLERAGGFLVTASREELFDAAAIGSDDRVVEGPGADPEGFLGIEGLPGVRGLESGEREQALVHDRHHVAHRLAVLLPDLEFQGGLRLGLLRGVEHRAEA